MGVVMVIWAFPSIGRRRKPEGMVMNEDLSVPSALLCPWKTCVWRGLEKSARARVRTVSSRDDKRLARPAAKPLCPSVVTGGWSLLETTTEVNKIYRKILQDFLLFF